MQSTSTWEAWISTLRGYLDESHPLDQGKSQFFYGLPLYPNELSSFLENGGTLSWGIVPASGANGLNPRELLNTLEHCVEQLVAKGMDRGLLYKQALLTPSCGLGTGSVERADRVLDTLVELSAMVREREGL